MITSNHNEIMRIAAYSDWKRLSSNTCSNIPCEIRIRSLNPPSLPLLQHILNESLSRLIRTPNKRPAGTIQEPHIQRPLPPHLKHIRGDILMHRHMPLRRSHVLPKRHDIHI